MPPTTETVKLGQALNRLCGIAFGFIGSQAFQSAYDLGVFDALHDEARTAEEVATRVRLGPVACRRLLGALVSLELVEREGERFVNSELGRLCSTQSAVPLGTVARVTPFFHMCEYMTDALREYSPRWQQALGTTAQDAWEALYADPRWLREFAALMNAFSVPQGRLIAECVDFSSCQCIMDVAGGPGGQSLEIGVKHPHLRGIVTDFEPVCAVAREHIAKRGLTDRFTAVASDLMEGPYPSGADVILLGHILHDWSDETCRKILRHCHAALPRGGMLLVSDSVLAPDFQGSGLANLKDLLMLVANEPHARERTAGEFESLLNETDFELTEVVHLEAPRDLVVARRG